MALSGSTPVGNSSGGSGHAHLHIEWTATQNYATNQSTITTRLILNVDSGWTSLSSASYQQTLNGGNLQTGSDPPGTPHDALTSPQTLLVRNVTLTHNSDGTATFSLAGQYTGDAFFGSIFTSKSGIVLDSIPRQPNVTTKRSMQSTATTTLLRGEVTGQGGSTVTERGFVWATTDSPTTSDNKVTVSGTLGEMEYALGGLSVGTTYYYRAYATNSQGTGYGDTMQFQLSPDAILDADKWIIETHSRTHDRVVKILRGQIAVPTRDGLFDPSFVEQIVYTHTLAERPYAQLRYSRDGGTSWYEALDDIPFDPATGGLDRQSVTVTCYTDVDNAVHVMAANFTNTTQTVIYKITLLL